MPIVNIFYYFLDRINYNPKCMFNKEGKKESVNSIIDLITQFLHMNRKARISREKQIRVLAKERR